MEGSHSHEDQDNRLLEPGAVGSSPAHDTEATFGKRSSHAVTWLCVILVAAGPLSFGYALGYTSPVLQKLQDDVQLSDSQAAFFSAVVNLGAMVGALASGAIADFGGRKVALTAAAIPDILGWLLIAGGTGTPALYLGRFLTGFGTGVISFTVPVYISEIAPGELRGTLGTVNQLAITTGIVAVYAGGLLMGWRALAAVGVLPLLILLASLAVIPESPRWLARAGKGGRMTNALKYLRGAQADVSAEAEEIEMGVRRAAAEGQLAVSELFGNCALRRPLVVALGLMVLQQFSGVNVVFFYSGSIFEKAGLGSPNVAALLVGLLQVGCTVGTAALMDRVGRRPLLMGSAAGMAVSNAALGLSFALQSPKVASGMSGSGILALISILVFVAFFSLGVGAIPWIIMSEIFPARARGPAGSVATLVNWAGAYAVTQTFQFLQRWSPAGAFWLYALECVGTVVFVALLVPETRGKSLEELEKILGTKASDGEDNREHVLG